jgi:hypothetical protein
MDFELLNALDFVFVRVQMDITSLNEWQIVSVTELRHFMNGLKDEG